MAAEHLIAPWKEVRSGLIQEAQRVPADRFDFRATPDTRSIAELLQHIVETQKFLVGETCREKTDLKRQSFTAHIKEYAAEVSGITDKNGLLELLFSSMETAEATIRSNADQLNDSMIRFDGQPTRKIDFLYFCVSHEMYHRGQLTVYERLLGIEPALTERFRKFVANAS